MPDFTLIDLILLGFLGTLVVLGLGIAAILIRQTMRQMEEATATIELLRARHDLLRLNANWARWTDSVDVPRPAQRLPSTLLN